jgi:hypothetical protein
MEGKRVTGGRWTGPFRAGRRLVFGVLLFATATPCFAQLYAGASILYSKQQVSDIGDRGTSSYPTWEWYTTANLFMGYRSGAWALEVGGGPLSRFHSEAISSTFDIKQEIKTKHIYATVLGHLRLDSAFSVHGRLGVSRVTMTNHEYGSNENGPNQDFQESSTVYAPMFGGGVTYTFRPITVRAEVFWINNVARSFHAEHSDITAYGLGLQYSF